MSFIMGSIDQSELPLIANITSRASIKIWTFEKPIAFASITAERMALISSSLEEETYDPSNESAATKDRLSWKGKQDGEGNFFFTPYKPTSPAVR